MNPTKLKIALGYTLLLAILMLSLLFVHREVEVLSAADTRRDLEADSLLMLLRQKDTNTIQMLRVLSEANEAAITPGEIEEIIATQDSISTQQRVQHRVITRRDSLITTPPKKGFFKRLAEAFVPSKHDSALLVNSSLELRVDTIIEPSSTVDSLHQRLRTVTQQKQVHRPATRRVNVRYRQRDTQLTARIDSLVSAYEQAITLRAHQDEQAGSDLRRRSARAIAGIAVGAVLLAALFLTLVLRDIGRSNRQRRELEAANRRANDLLLAREKMMLAITHDFKAPLGSILGYADLLTRLTADDRQRFYLDNMRTSSRHLLRLVTDLLDFHRLDLRKETMNRVTFHPLPLLEEVHTAFAPLAAQKGLALRLDVDEALDGTFISDPLRIRQILTNLLSNAIKFTTQGSVTLTARYAASQLTLAVADTGQGMAASDCERIFQEFTRLPGAQGEEGFGLGLSIVHKLVTLLEGEIKVDSVWQKGSTFTVLLPLYPVHAQGGATGDKADDEAPAADVLARPEASLRVVLIDDDRIQLTLTAAMLTQAGITAVCCEQLDELTEALRTQTFDLLLSDVQMPAINGFDLLRLLRASNIEHARTIPIMAVTARSDMSVAEFRAHGFAGVLRKPFTVAELQLAVAGWAPVADIPLPDARIEVNPPGTSLCIGNLTAFSGDDKEAAEEILNSFVEQTEQEIVRFEAALAHKNTATLAAVAHKLLPLLTLVQAGELVKLLALVEQCRDHTSLDVETAVAAAKAIELLHTVVAAARREPLYGGS
ncbi:MAG: ATP-binding protein [Pseudomonas sp.]